MILPRGEPIETRVRAVMIVVVAPRGNQMTSMAEVGEEMLVEAFVPQPTVEALDQPILHGLARRDIVPLD